jgi:hypothetical protein
MATAEEIRAQGRAYASERDAAEDRDARTDWSKWPISDFQADGRARVQFVCTGTSEEGEQQIAPRRRTFQRGAKLDATGAQPDGFTLSLVFHNDLEEPDLTAPLQQYPDNVDELLEQFHIGETGTLNLPWKRGIRCKASKWRRTESATDTTGGCLVEVLFTTDNEDSLDRESFQKVSVRAAADGAVEEARFDLESLNMFDGSIEDITALAADLVGLLNMPGERLGGLLHAANRLRRAVKFLIDGFSTAVTGRNGMNDPAGANARIKLLKLLELAGAAQDEALAEQPKTRDIKYKTAVDIWSVAAELRQPARTLQALNGAIPNLSHIEPGTPIKVLA